MRRKEKRNRGIFNGSANISVVACLRTRGKKSKAGGHRSSQIFRSICLLLRGLISIALVPMDIAVVVSCDGSLSSVMLCPSHGFAMNSKETFSQASNTRQSTRKPRMNCAIRNQRNIPFIARVQLTWCTQMTSRVVGRGRGRGDGMTKKANSTSSSGGARGGGDVTIPTSFAKVHIHHLLAGGTTPDLRMTLLHPPKLLHKANICTLSFRPQFAQRCGDGWSLVEWRAYPAPARGSVRVRVRGFTPVHPFI